MLSLKTISEINCKNLSIRDLDFFTFKEKWEKEKISIQVNQKEIGKNEKRNECIFLNEILCDRVLN